MNEVAIVGLFIFIFIFYLFKTKVFIFKFWYKSEYLNQAKNILVVLPSSPIKILGKLAMGLQTNKHKKKKLYNFVSVDFS